MNVLESLRVINDYVIPDLEIQKAGIANDLLMTDTLTKSILESKAYELAYADLLVWLHNSPNLTEQEVSMTILDSIRGSLMDQANALYRKWESPKFSGRVFGYIGEEFNNV